MRLGLTAIVLISLSSAASAEDRVANGPTAPTGDPAGGGSVIGNPPAPTASGASMLRPRSGRRSAVAVGTTGPTGLSYSDLFPSYSDLHRWGFFSGPTAPTGPGELSDIPAEAIVHPTWEDEYVAEVRLGYRGDRRGRREAGGSREDWDTYVVNPNGRIRGSELLQTMRPRVQGAFQRELQARGVSGTSGDYRRLYRDYLRDGLGVDHPAGASPGLRTATAIVALNRILDHEAMKLRLDPTVEDDRVSYVTTSILTRNAASQGRVRTDTEAVTNPDRQPLYGDDCKALTRTVAYRSSEIIPNVDEYRWLEDGIGQRQIAFNIDWNFTQGDAAMYRDALRRHSSVTWPAIRIEFDALPRTHESRMREILFLYLVRSEFKHMRAGLAERINVILAQDFPGGMGDVLIRQTGESAAVYRGRVRPVINRIVARLKDRTPHFLSGWQSERLLRAQALAAVLSKNWELGPVAAPVVAPADGAEPAPGAPPVDRRPPIAVADFAKVFADAARPIYPEERQVQLKDALLEALGEMSSADVIRLATATPSPLPQRALAAKGGRIPSRLLSSWSDAIDAGFLRDANQALHAEDWTKHYENAYDEFERRIRDRLQSENRVVIRQHAWRGLLARRSPDLSWRTTFSVSVDELERMYAANADGFKRKENVAQVTEIQFSGSAAPRAVERLDQLLSMREEQAFEDLFGRPVDRPANREEADRRRAEQRRELIELRRTVAAEAERTLRTEFAADIRAGRLTVTKTARDISDRWDVPEELVQLYNPLFADMSLFPSLPTGSRRQGTSPYRCRRVLLADILKGAEFTPFFDPRDTLIRRLPEAQRATARRDHEWMEPRISNAVQGKFQAYQFRDITRQLFQENPIEVRFDTCRGEGWPCIDRDATRMAEALFPERYYPSLPGPRVENLGSTPEAPLGFDGPRNPIRSTIGRSELMGRVMAIGLDYFSQAFRIENGVPGRR